MSSTDPNVIKPLASYIFIRSSTVMRFCLILDHIVCLFSLPMYVRMCIQLSVFVLSCLYFGPMALQY